MVSRACIVKNKKWILGWCSGPFEFETQWLLTQTEKNHLLIYTRALNNCRLSLNILSETSDSMIRGWYCLLQGSQFVKVIEKNGWCHFQALALADAEGDLSGLV